MPTKSSLYKNQKAALGLGVTGFGSEHGITEDSRPTTQKPDGAGKIIGKWVHDPVNNSFHIIPLQPT